jgi:hypothetical protein
LSDYYRIRDAIHLLQHYDDLLTIIRKDWYDVNINIKDNTCYTINFIDHINDILN